MSRCYDEDITERVTEKISVDPPEDYPNNQELEKVTVEDFLVHSGEYDEDCWEEQLYESLVKIKRRQKKETL